MQGKGWQCLGLFALGFILGGGVPAGAQNLPSQLISYPELVIVNGKILTADDQFTMAQAVAIREGKFLAVGDNALIRRMIGPQTKVIDVQGKTVIPGIINTHLHLADNAERPINWWKNDREALETVRQRVSTVPEGRWIVLWFNSSASHLIQGKIKKAELDAIAPKHPVVIGAHTGGYYMANSLALQKLQFPARPPEGIVKDAQTEEPTGELVGTAARSIGIQVGWLDPIPEKVTRLKEAIETVIPLGTTTIHTRINPDGLTALREVWAAKELKLRWRVALTGFRGSEDFFQSLGNLTGVGDDMFRLTGVAAGASDGNVGTGEGWTFEQKVNPAPWEGDLPFGSSGEQWKRSRETLMAAVKYGWSVVGIHSDGDRGTAEVIADYEKARFNRLVPSMDQTLRVDHLSVVRDDEIRKMKELGIVPSVAAWHAFLRPNNVVHMYGVERVGRMARGKSFLDAGLRPAGEISSSCPFWSMQFKVTRKAEGRVYGAPEKVSREEALKMHTIYGALYIREQDRLGTIEAGKLADLAVINGDYMTIPEDQIETLTVQKTILGGRVVFETDTPQPCTSERYENIRDLTSF